MSNVDVSIGGRDFKVACAAGEEDHIRDLGKMIDEKVSGLGMAGQSEGRMLLFASLLLADEVHESKFRGGSGEAPAPAAAPNDDPALAERLEAIAAALEKCALHLES
ncbi:MAG: cell division protein ZapA [Novosphingobium sp.]